MSQAEELLNSLTEDDISTYTADAESEGYIIIDENRVITVPDSLKRIAVQYDHNVETVTFKCPRYWDSTDLSTMKVYINYALSNGVLGSYESEVTSADNTHMYFSWTIKREITNVAGSIAFLVCVKDGEDADPHWNSELNKEMFVSQGLEARATIAGEYPDVITQILTRLDNIGSGGGGAGGAVTSVNGETGDVELDADDVGAVSKDVYNNEYYYGDPTIEPSPIDIFTYREEADVVYIESVKSTTVKKLVVPYELLGKRTALDVYDLISIPSSVTTLILPRGLEMGSYNVMGCPDITELVLPTGITIIPSQNFQGLGINTLVIPEGVTTINNDAFNDCMQLKKIYVPDSVVDIYDEEWGTCFVNVPITATFICSHGSAAEAFAKKYGYGIEYTGVVIDDKPTEGSENAVSSGGMYEVIGDIETALDSIIAMADAVIGGDA